MNLSGLRRLDGWLNRLTMYRLMVYVLAVLAIASVIMSATGYITISPLALFVPAALLILVCWAVNSAAARVLKISVSVESWLITALILFFLVAPSFSIRSLSIIAAAGAIAMASKYIFAIRRQHLFNPAALAAVILIFTVGEYVVWWVNAVPLIPFVIVGGLLITRKTRRFDLVFSCLASAAVTTALVA